MRGDKMKKQFSPYRAVALVRGGGKAPSINGKVSFEQKRGGVLVTASISGLPRGNGAGFFGFHIHSGKSCGGADFADTDGHFSKEWDIHPRHSGDLPPLLSDNGWAFMKVLTNRFTVSDVIGRTVVIHSGVDDFTSQPAGNAGTKIACGVIKEI